MPEPQRGSVVAYVKESENWILHEVRETKDRILGYIFGLNAGGLVAAAAYLSQKGSNCLVVVAIVLFGLGLLVAVVRAAIDYYDCEAVARSTRKDVGKFYSDQIEWDQFLAARKEGTIPQWPYHFLGFTSGIFFFLGLFVGIAGSLR